MAPPTDDRVPDIEAETPSKRAQLDEWPGDLNPPSVDPEAAPPLAPVLEKIAGCGASDGHVAEILASAPAPVRRGPALVMPRGVKRAIDYMQTNLAGPITIEQVVEVSRIARRTLFKHFRDFRGTTPMEYLRDARFRLARGLLMRGDSHENVTAVAMRCGFNHLGRFSVDYRRRFGESPSQTIRRRRF